MRQAQDNPFQHNKAEAYTWREALERFEQNRAWSSVRSAESLVLYGLAGSGKSHLLKRLSAPAMLARPEFTGPSFLGVYLNLHDVALLGREQAAAGEVESLFSRPESGRRLQAAYAAHLAIAQAALDTVVQLEDLSSDPRPGLFDRLRPALQLLALPDSPASIGEAREAVWQQLSRVSLGAATASPPLACSGARLSAFCAGIGHALTADGPFAGSKFGLLIDQLDDVDPQHRPLFATLLRRTNPFFAILASRPGSFTPHALDGSVRVIDDFSYVSCDYIPNDPAGYVALVRAIINRLASPTDATRVFDSKVERALRHVAGVEHLARVSSGSVRWCLEMCKEAVFSAQERGLDWKDGLPADIQSRAIEKVCEFVHDDVLAVDEIPKGQLWRLLSAVRNAAARSDSVGRVPGISVTLRAHNPDTTATGNINRLLERAIQVGVLRCDRPQDAERIASVTSFIVPCLFSQSLGLNPSWHYSAELDPTLIERVARPAGRRRTVAQIHRSTAEAAILAATGDLKSVFLSTSFEDAQEPRASIELLNQRFARAGVVLRIGSAIGHGQLYAIMTQMQACQMCLVDVSRERANCMLEMGLAVALGKRVVAISRRSRDAGREFATAESLQYARFTSSEGRIEYDFSPDSLDHLVERAKSEYAGRASSVALVLASQVGGHWLRPSRNASSAFVHLPERLQSFSEHLALDLQVGIPGSRIVSPARLGFQADALEGVVCCVSQSATCLIDTTPPATGASASLQADPDGSFALGFAFGLAQAEPRSTRRLLYSGVGPQEGLSLWPSALVDRWSTTSDIVRIARSQIRKKGRKS